MKSRSFLNGFIIGLVFIFLFLIILFLQGKLVWETESKPMQMPKKDLPQTEQIVDSLKNSKEVLDTLPSGDRTN